MTPRAKTSSLLRITVILTLLGCGAARAEAAGNYLLVPVAGSVSGVHGTFFKTDVTIRNGSDSLQHVQVYFLPADHDNARFPRTTDLVITLEAGAAHTFDVGSLLETTGIGALLIKGTKSDIGDDDPPDPDARLTATFRIYTAQPGGGTTSQSADATDLGGMEPFRSGIAAGLRQDASFRTNVGVVNLDPAASRTFRVTGTSTTGATRTIDIAVPAMSMSQQPLPAGDLGHMSVSVEVLGSDKVESPWTAYATTIDNATGDSWMQQLVPDRLAGPGAQTATTLLIPVAGSVPGAQGTYFRTDVALTNHRDVPQIAVLGVYTPGNYFYGEPIASGEFTVPARSTITVENVMTYLAVPGQLGSIIINGDYPPPYDRSAILSAAYRIWTQQPGGGSVSQSAPALDLSGLPPGNVARVIIGARLDANFRCNVGIANQGFYDRLFRVTARSPSGSTTMTMQAEGYAVAQVSLPDADLGYVTIEIEPLDVGPDEIWTAYASSVDNRSGDSWLQNATVK